MRELDGGGEVYEDLKAIDMIDSMICWSTGTLNCELKEEPSMSMSEGRVL
jgi:hypothetical protein